VVPISTHHPDLWRQVEERYGKIDTLSMVRYPSLMGEICKHEQHMATMVSQVRAVLLLDSDDLIVECHIFKPNPDAATITVMMRR
jgi:hypothetical protein